MPIAVSEIATYLNMIGIEGTATKMKYMRLIKRMDGVELEHIRSRLGKK